jgi:hypothetical protein
MSGASALAAAKRRRAVPAENTRPSSSPTKPNQNQMPKPVQPSVTSNVQSASQTPLQLLVQHEQRLIDLERSVVLLKTDEKKPESITPDTIQHFKNQYEQMSQEVQELKKIIIKVQTFSMETNLELLKIKKAVKTDTNDAV